MAASSAVTTGDIATAAQYNNLRTDVLDSSSSHTHAGTSNTGVKVNSNNLQGTVLASTVVTSSLTTVGTIATGVWQGTDVGVAYGGTGVSTLTDGGVLLGSGASAITAMAVLADSEMIVGDGTTDPVAESGATLRTSIGVGTGDSPQFTDLTLTDDLTLNSDSSVFKMGDDDGFSITHDGDLGATIAGSPITITAAEASTWSTSSGVLTIDGDDGIILQTTGSGGVTISEATRINVDAGSIATPDASTGLTLVNSSATGDGVQLSLISGNAGYGQIWFGDVNDENRGRFNYKQDTDTFGWSTATAASMYLSGGISPTLQLGSAATADSTVYFDTNTTPDYHIGWDAGANSLALGAGSAPGTTPFLRIFGTGVQPYNMLVGGTGTSSGASTYAVGVAFSPIVTSHSGDSANVSLVSMGSQISGANSLVTGGNTSVAATLYLKEPNISTSHTITSAATLYIEDAPTEGASSADYALWVDDGTSRFDGFVEVGAVGAGTMTQTTGVRAANSGSTGNNAFMGIQSGNAGISYLLMGDNDNDDIGFIAYDQANDRFRFATNAAYSMDISGGATAVLTIGSAAAADTAIVFDGNAVDWHIGLDDGNDTLTLGQGSAVGTTPRMVFQATGNHYAATTIGGAYTSGGDSTVGIGLQLSLAITGHAGDEDYLTQMLAGTWAGGSLTTGRTVTNAATVTITEPNLSEAGGAITNGASLWIPNAPTEATNNYALFVDAGVSRFDGDVDLNASGTLLNVGNAGGDWLSNSLTIGSGTGNTLYGSTTSSANGFLILSSSDTADNGLTAVLGGHDNTAGSGGAVFVYGEAHSSGVGDVSIRGSNGTNKGKIDFYTSGSKRLEVEDGGEFMFQNNGIYDVGSAYNQWATGSFIHSDSGNTAMYIQSYSTTATQTSFLALDKSNNGTEGTHTALTADDVMGAILFRASNGSAFEAGGKIHAEATETWSGSAMGTKLVFSTTDNTTTTIDERVTIAHDGNVGIGSTAPDSPLHINVADENLPLVKLEADMGSSNNRTLTIHTPATDSATEPFRINTNNALSFEIDGTERIDLDSGGVTNFYGTVHMRNNSIIDVGNAGNEWTARQFKLENEYSGGKNQIILRNDSADASSSAELQIGIDGGNTSSDAFINIFRTTSTNIYWSLGLDNSNSQAFVISNNNGLGTNDALRITNATPPVTTYNTTHPTGTFDYVCDSCGRHEAEQFECCGKVEWHDDVLDFRAMALRQPEGIDYMEKVGVIERTLDNEGNPEVFTVLGKDFEFAMSAAFQNRQRMDAQFDEMKGLINRLEKELEEVRNG